jgi:two-component system response regulator AtoC
MIAGAGMKSLKEKVVEIEKEAIVNALRECNWVMSKAARKLGITERMIGYKMTKYGIKRSGMKDSNSFYRI